MGKRVDTEWTRKAEKWTVKADKWTRKAKNWTVKAKKWTVKGKKVDSKKGKVDSKYTPLCLKADTRKTVFTSFPFLSASCGTSKQSLYVGGGRRKLVSIYLSIRRATLAPCSCSCCLYWLQTDC